MARAHLNAKRSDGGLLDGGHACRGSRARGWRRARLEARTGDVEVRVGQACACGQPACLLFFRKTSPSEGAGTETGRHRAALPPPRVVPAGAARKKISRARSRQTSPRAIALPRAQGGARTDQRARAQHAGSRALSAPARERLGEDTGRSLCRRRSLRAARGRGRGQRQSRGRERRTCRTPRLSS